MRCKAFAYVFILAAGLTLSGCDKPAPEPAAKPATKVRPAAEPAAAEPTRKPTAKPATKAASIPLASSKAVAPVAASDPKAARAVQPTVADAPVTTDKPSSPAKPPRARPNRDAKPKAKPPRLKITKTQGKVTRKAWRKLVKEGRRASRAEQYKVAIDRFERALKLVPSQPGVLGELGWARFKVGELKRAEAHLHQALRGTSKPSQRGALLYNLGRILEARGGEHLAAAARHYEASLSVRHNATVEARRKKLGPQPDESPGDALADAVCFRAMSSWYCELKDPKAPPRDEEFQMIGECTCGVEQVTVPKALPGDGIKGLARLVVDGYSDGGIYGCEHLAVQFGDRWFLGPLVVNNFKPPVGYVDNIGQLESLKTHTAPGVGRFVVARVTHEFSDKDPGLDEVTESVDKTVHVCWRSKKGPACLQIMAELRSGTRVLVPGDMGQPDERTAEEKREDADAAELSEYRLSVKVQPDGKIAITQVKGPLDTDTKGWLGTHTIEELAKLKGIEVKRL